MSLLGSGLTWYRLKENLFLVLTVFFLISLEFLHAFFFFPVLLDLVGCVGVGCSQNMPAIW